ncbi:MAG TPA: TolC family protein [Saprospiraceae bacterium]|nr:TolC family protein [Saprospiraceae bacterium]
MKNSITLFFLVSFFAIFGQESLTLEQALQTAKTNNPAITINQIEEQIAKMQVYKANVGMVPRVDWNTSVGSAFNYVNQEFISGATINRFGRNFAPNTNLSVNYTLFDGNSMKTRLEILDQQSQRSGILTKNAEEVLTNEVINNFYQIARQKEGLRFLNSVVKYYQERLSITEQRWQIGRGSKLDYLQSQNDYNTQMTDIKNAELQLQNLKVRLNLLLNRDPFIEFDIVEPLATVENYNLEQAYLKAEKESEELALIAKDLDINALQIKVIQAQKKPQINVFGTFGYSFSTSNAGFLLFNQSTGTNFGISAVWNVFDGGQVKNQSNIGKYRAQSLFKQRELVQQRIKSELSLAYNQWKIAGETLQLEEINKNLAQENLEISLEKFRLGASTILELNDAQQRFDNASNRYINAMYNLKFAALEMERLMR